MNPIIDVSKHNGSIDWAKVKGNAQAAIIRMGYRGYHKGTLAIDPMYRENRQGCEAAGVPFSFYFFPCSINDTEAEEEANLIIREAQGMVFYLPIFLDSEISDPTHKAGRSDHLDRATRTHLLKLIIDKCQGAGVPMGVYASTSWLENNLDMSQLPYSVWCAQYASKCKYTGFYMMWQYSSKGTISGVTGRVDVSVPHNPNDVGCPYKEPSKSVRYGDKGESVKWVQWELVHRGFTLQIDGDFGENTLTAVRTFQTTASLEADGIVGRLTRAAILS